MESELLAAQLRSVNTSVYGASIEKLRVDTWRNISKVRESTQDSLDVIRDEVIRNTNYARTGLSRRIDAVASKQDTNTALLSQHSANISNLIEVGISKSYGIGAVTVIVVVVIVVVAFIFILYLKHKSNK